jgi:1-acyl-sn-glycerol-3-phosphate acyltransferase
MIIYPEGTRKKLGDPAELQAFKSGAFRVATKAGVPLLPVVLHGTASACDRSFRFAKASIRMHICDPVTPDDTGCYAADVQSTMVKVRPRTPPRFRSTPNGSV